MSVLIAVMVKTPGLSPVKTRLASRIGPEEAERFHLLSCRAVRERVHDSIRKSNVHVEFTWAVAEPQGLESPHWFPDRCVEQGQGALGDRLDLVYRNGLADHAAVILLGGDSPAMDGESVVRAIQLLDRQQTDFVLAGTEDGGYYLFGGRQPLLLGDWTAVPYSSNETESVFLNILEAQGSVKRLPLGFDVDEVEDLRRLEVALKQGSGPSFPLLASQRELLQWWENLKNRDAAKKAML